MGKDRDLAVEVGFADVGHGHQLNCLAVAANVFPDLDREPTRSKCQKASAEMVHSEGRENDKVNNHRGEKDENVHQKESRQVQPAKAP